MSAWIYLLALSFLVFVPFAIKYRQNLKKALLLGLFLAVFDWVFESAGALLNLWVSKGSIFFLWNIPLEVFLIAIFSGSVYYFVLEKKSSLGWLVLTSLLVAVVGMTMERALIELSLLQYFLAWNSVLAFISYFLVFAILFWVKELIKLKIK